MFKITMTGSLLKQTHKYNFISNNTYVPTITGDKYYYFKERLNIFISIPQF